MAQSALVPAILVLLTALVTAKALVWRFGEPPALGRIVPLDGLRGFLAMSVFVFHSIYWYIFLRTGQWPIRPEDATNVINHLGPGAVATFFMITSFLFTTKIMHWRSAESEWGKLILGRFMRLAPLYALQILALVIVVACLSHWTLQEPISHLVKELAEWTAFNLFGSPNINLVKNTWQIVAGVDWTLAWEILFYLMLPAVALLLGIRLRLAGLAILCIGLAILAIRIPYAPERNFPFFFISGSAVAVLCQWKSFTAIATGWRGSILVIACIALSVTMFDTPLRTVPILLYTVAFAFIAGGNTLFGLLTCAPARTLGEISYGIYLLHGLLLFLLFTVILGQDNARNLSPLAHYLWVIGLTPVLVMLSFTTFQCIESPGIKAAKPLYSWIRSRVATHPDAQVTANADGADRQDKKPS